MTYDPHEHHHRHDPETSVQAAYQARETVEQHKLIIRDVLVFAGALTSDEIAEVCPLNKVQIARRMSDLVRDGDVVDSGERRPSPAGRLACVWRLI